MTRVLVLLMLVIATALAVKEKGPTTTATGKNEDLKGLAFFKHFGAKLNRHKVFGDVQLLECDYDHPEKSGFCPPIGYNQPYSDREAAVKEQ